MPQNPQSSQNQDSVGYTRLQAWSDRIRAWHVALLCLVLYLPALGTMPLAEPDEGRYAEIPREMLASGDLVTPRLNDVLYFEKPVLYYWMVAGAQQILGRNELAARAVTFLSGLLGILLTFYLGRSLGSRRLGVYASIVLCLTPLWAGFSRINTIDLAVSVMIAATLACFWWASRDGAGKGPWWALFACSALAVLTKGLIGIVLPGGVIFVYLLLTRRWRLLLRVPWISGILLFALIAVPWHALVAQRNPEFLWFYFIHEHLLRYTTDVAERTGPAWYYLPVLLVGLLPWSGLLPASWSLFRSPRDEQERDAAIFLGSWAGVILLFFSVSKSKLIPYVLPIWPALALLAAMVLLRALDSDAPPRRGALWGMRVTTPLLVLLLGAFAWAATGPAGPLLGREEFFSAPLLLIAILGTLLAVVATVRLFRGSLARAVPWLFFASAALLGCLVIGGLEVMKGRTAKGIAECIEAHGARDDDAWPVVAYRTFPETLPFYLDHTIEVVNFQGELSFGISRLSDQEREAQYSSVEQFQARWNSGAPLFLVTRRQVLATFEEQGFHPGVILKQERKLVLLTNQPTTDLPAGCG